MKKNKIILNFISFIILTSLSVTPVSAASTTRTGRVNSTYLTVYRYGYNYSIALDYASGGTITYYSDIVISNKTCDNSAAIGSFGCSIIAQQYSKSIHSASSAVTYVVNVQVSALTGAGIPIYVGSRNDTITVALSRSNSREINEDDITTTIEQGDLHYVQEDAENFALTYGVDIEIIEQYHVTNNE